MAGREKRGTKIVNIDPRRTATAETADLHLAIAPGTDVLLWNGLLAYLSNQNAIDADWTGRPVSELEESVAAAHAMALSLAMTAAACGLKTEDVRAFYELFTGTERVV